MIEKFDRRYRIGSARLSKWDYGWNASYFVTICTEEKLPHFGSIHNQQFIANSMGEIALHRWLEMSSHYPFVQLGRFIVMPNHVHGIVRINNGFGKNRDNRQRMDANERDDADQRRDIYQRRDAINRVSTAAESTSSQSPSPSSRPTPTASAPQDAFQAKQHGGITGHHNPMLHNNLSRVIR